MDLHKRQKRSLKSSDRHLRYVRERKRSDFHVYVLDIFIKQLCNVVVGMA